MGVSGAIDITTSQRKTIVGLLKRYLPNVAVWAYGSRVKWTARPESDLDMVVFASPEQKKQVSDMKEALEESDLPFRVDMFIWDEVPEQFRRNIEAEHVVLVERQERVVGGGWKCAKFSELCGIGRGGSPRPIHDFIRESGIPWVKIADATSAKTRFIEKTKEFIRPEGISKSREVFPGDLILSNSATPGLPMFMSIRACIHDGWLLLRNFKNIDKLFCYYLLVHERPNIVRYGSGSVFTNLKTDILKNHEVCIPPLPEQRAIAHILGSLDDKIELNRRMNSTLEKMAQTIFKSWFINFDPVRAKAEGHDPGLPKDIADLFPDSFEDSELGEIPKGWEASTVNAGFDVTMGQSPPGSTYNENGHGLPFFQGRRDFGFRYPTKRVYCSEPKRIANVGDTLISVRAPVGDINMAYDKCCVGRGVAAVRHKSGSRSFSYYSMRALGERFSRFEGEGTVFGSINKKQFDALPFIMPAPSIVEEFENQVGKLDENMRINTEEIRTLVCTRDTLLPKLISGELRVPDAEKFVEEASG
ncbi:MAG: restriction endonuclease subunit S [Nitrospiria bacterium]